MGWGGGEGCLDGRIEFGLVERNLLYISNYLLILHGLGNELFGGAEVAFFGFGRFACGD